MNNKHLLAGSLALLTLSLSAVAVAAPPLPDLDEKPTPRVDAGGPSAAVTALAFSADGETLYAGGLDKVVRVWTRQQGQWVPKTTHRVPIGPGNAGGVNAVALSPDGGWIAIAGRAPMRGEIGFRRGGVIVEAAALSREQNEDAGVIYVADTGNPAGGKVLRGHRGEVRALAFAPAAVGQAPLLLSAATQREGARQFGGLRLWDVTTGQTLAERDDLPANAARPGLAVWRTGPGAIRVCIAVAWPEEPATKPGSLRLWDPSSGAQPLQAWEDDPFTQTLALMSQSGGIRLLTGGFGPESGRLRVWQLGPERQTRAQFASEVTFPPRAGTHFRPVSLALVALRGDGNPSHAAVIVQPSTDADFRLALVDLRTYAVVAEVPLVGSDKSQLPAITAHGGQLAVAATHDHAVRLYSVAQLLAGKAEPEVVLASAGLTPRQVAFVIGGQALWLSEQGQARLLSDGLLFDLEKRQVRANERANLTADAPEMGEWSAVVDPDRKGVTVRHGSDVLPPVRLHGAHDVVTAAALRPEAPGRPGVLAVAYTERDASRTLILLADPATGKPYRLLVSHLQDVRALAFSASRPLLASVADDQMLCVWSLADLDREVGQVPGLGVADEAQKVMVESMEPGSVAAKAGLAKGDVLENVGVPGGEMKPIKDAAGFLLAVSARRPGDQIEVAVSGKGAIKLAVERGVDERKPLFSLFLLRTRGLPEWVGWSPAGPYDFSGPAAEAHLGWQTNTGDPAAPVSYAAARAYRKDYYRQDILRYLAADADLGRALQDWDRDHPAQPPQPALRLLRPEGAQPTDRTAEYLVRQSVTGLEVGINEDYALNDQHVLRWRLTRTEGGNVKGDATETSGQAARAGNRWRIDLSPVAWRRGDYRVRVALQARAEGPELAAETATLRFQPPAPVIALRRNDASISTAEQRPLAVQDDKLTLQIALEAPAGQEVEVRFVQDINGLPRQDVPAAHMHAGAGAFSQQFQLREGLNHLIVRAVNKGALAGHEDEETAASQVWVSYRAPRELPPRFTTLRLEPEPEVEHHDGKERWVVSRPTVSLVGKIEGEGVLREADWSLGDGWKSVLPPSAGRSAEFAVALELKAGQIMPLRLRARSERSDANTAERQVLFHPPLPTLAMDPLDSQELLTDNVLLMGTYQSATDDPFDVRFRVASAEGKVKDFKPEVDQKARRWKVGLALFPGSNSVEAFVANRWRGEQAVGGVLRLLYRRPPQITAFPREVEAVETNKVRLALTVEGPAGRPLTGVKVGPNALPFKSGQPETRGDRWVWQVELPEVFVNDGDRNLDRLSVHAVSDEGESWAAVVRVIHKKLPRPPRARFLSPAAADTARRPEYQVAFRVESELPLERVEIRRGDEVLYRADLQKAEREGPLHVLQGEAPLGLKGGPNALELVAVNRDGRSPRAEVVVSYTEPAVLIGIDRIELMADNGDVQSVLKPVRASNGDLSFPETPRSLAWLVGHVRWSDPQAKALDDRHLQVVVKVGDCRQLPVALGPRARQGEPNFRPFRVPLVLIGPKNRIRVEVPSLGQQQQSRSEFDLACAAPTQKQRLHLLIVGVDVNDPAELKKRILDTLIVKPQDRPAGAQGEFVKNPPFERCILYHVLAGEVDRGKLEAQLAEINTEILRLRRASGWLNDIVLIYYQGEDFEVPEKRERWLKTSRNFQFPKAPPTRFAIPCHSLRTVPGAQLLLLNVAGSTATRVAGSDWGGDPDTGFLRYACNDPSEVRKADPALLGFLQEALRKKGRLGEVVQYVNELLRQRPASISPLIVLDEDEARRWISEPGR
jgi:WD40 repeat protein